MSEHIELPEITATTDATDQLLAESVAAVEAGDDPLENLSMHELHLIETGEASPELMALVNAATQEDEPDVENNASDAPEAVDNMQSVQSAQYVEPPADRDFAAEFGQLDTTRSELMQQMTELVRAIEDGDKLESEVLDDKQALQDKINALAMERLQLEQAKQGYQQQLQAFETQQQQQQADWQKTCTEFVGVKHKGFYLGEGGQPNNERLADLDAVIKSTAKANPTMRDADILQKAHEKVMRMYGVGAAKTVEAKPATAAAKPQLPPTLGSMPRAEAANTGGQFAALNAAKGDALVNAVEKMTPEQLDAWLNEA